MGGTVAQGECLVPYICKVWCLNFIPTLCGDSTCDVMDQHPVQVVPRALKASCSIELMDEVQANRGEVFHRVHSCPE